MALKALVTGPIAKPVLRWTGQQRPVLELRIHATAAARDKVTGDWNDVGDPLWISATFWDQDAERYAETLNQGDRVTVEGTLILNTYQRRDGGVGTSLSLRLPRFLGLIPSRSHSAAGTAHDVSSAAGPPDIKAPF